MRRFVNYKRLICLANPRQIGCLIFMFSQSLALQTQPIAAGLTASIGTFLKGGDYNYKKNSFSTGTYGFGINIFGIHQAANLQLEYTKNRAILENKIDDARSLFRHETTKQIALGLRLNPMYKFTHGPYLSVNLAAVNCTVRTFSNDPFLQGHLPTDSFRVRNIVPQVGIGYAYARKGYRLEIYANYTAYQTGHYPYFMKYVIGLKSGYYFGENRQFHKSNDELNSAK